MVASTKSRMASADPFESSIHVVIDVHGVDFDIP
jgi:hypothetical protein